jgi:hypothetical protein
MAFACLRQPQLTQLSYAPETVQFPDISRQFTEAQRLQAAFRGCGESAHRPEQSTHRRRWLDYLTRDKTLLYSHAKCRRYEDTAHQEW